MVANTRPTMGRARARSLLGSPVLAGFMLWHPCAYAQTPPPGSLTQLVISAPAGTFDQLERLSAFANQASYNFLTGNPQGSTYCDPSLSAPSKTCPANVFLAFSNLRELIQSANELLDNGQPTQYSLHTDDLGVGFALQWTAGEEIAAPGSVATQFANGQLSSVASRITALRFGAGGFSLGAMNSGQQGAPMYGDDSPRALGGGASADGGGIGIASRWGGFLNGSFGWGKRDPSVLEDAFAFDSKDATAGVDYRFTRTFVLGVSAGYTAQRIDFDSALSVVGGGVRSTGYSGVIYALWDWNGPYLSGSVGWQRLDYSTTRLITYPSFNIAVPSVNATAYGSPSSNALVGTLTFGWSFTPRSWTLEPYLTADYRNITIAAFRETSVINAGPDAGQPAGFDLAYAAQSIRLLDAAVGARIQYAFRPSFGVIVPYARGEYHRTFDTNPYTVVSTYAAIAGSGADFSLPSDAPQRHYYVAAAGLSLVLPHGIQAFAQFEELAGMQYVSDRQITGGVRAEF